MVKDTDFVHFSDVSWTDGGAGVEESTQDCCGLPEMLYTLSGYNLEGLGPLRFEHGVEQKITIPLKRLPSPSVGFSNHHPHYYVENSKTLVFSVKMGVMRVNWSFILSFLVCVLQEAAGGGGWEFWLGQCRTRVASVFCESVCVMRVWVGVIRVPLARSAFYFLSVTVLCLVLCLLCQCWCSPEHRNQAKGFRRTSGSYALCRRVFEQMIVFNALLAWHCVESELRNWSSEM